MHGSMPHSFVGHRYTNDSCCDIPKHSGTTNEGGNHGATQCASKITSNPNPTPTLPDLPRAVVRGGGVRDLGGRAVWPG